MIPLSQINKNELEKVVRLFNKSGVLKENIKTIGPTKLELVNVFTYEVEHTPEELLPEEVKDFYNFIYQDEDVSGKKIHTKVGKRISNWGAVENTQAFILDEMIQTGGFTLTEMARACCTNIARVKRHLFERKRSFNFHYLVYQGKYYIKPNEEGSDGLQKNKRIVRGFDF